MFLFRYLITITAFLVSPLAVGDEVIRIMAANTSSGNFQSYDPGEGNRIFRGLAPDIALVQELNVGTSPNKNTSSSYRTWVNANFGTSFSYYVEPSGNIPNGIVSRFPILASGEWDDTTMTDRDYVWARIDIPGDKDLWVVSVHISSGGGASQRNIEAGEIKTYIQTHVPMGDYLVVGGDLNTTSRTEDCIATLSSVLETSGPYPADQAGDADTNNGATRNKSYDWVIADADLNNLKTPLVIGSNTFSNGLVFDSRVYSSLSEVAPVLVSDSDRLYPGGAVTNMQHMAVMRAFLIPANIAPDPWAVWKNTYFTTQEQSQGLATDLADADADGFLNLAEYALGTHPREFTPPLPYVMNESEFSISFIHPIGLPGIRYAADSSPDLVHWSVVSVVAPEPGALRAVVPLAGGPPSPHFLRLRFERE